MTLVGFGLIAGGITAALAAGLLVRWGWRRWQRVARPDFNWRETWLKAVDEFKRAGTRNRDDA